MTGFLVTRLSSALLVILGVVCLVFLLIHLIPGDPVDVMLGETARPADREALRVSLGLDQPLGRQLLDYLVGVARLDLGNSLHSDQPVSQLLAARLPNMSAGLRGHPGQSFLVGLLSVFAALLLLIPAILVLLLLVLTLVGIPIAFLAALFVGGVVLLTWLLPLYTFSRYSFEARGLNRFLSVGIWTGIFWIVHSLGQALGSPGPGLIVVLVEILVALLGLGALVLTRFGSRALATR